METGDDGRVVHLLWIEGKKGLTSLLVGDSVIERGRVFGREVHE